MAVETNGERLARLYSENLDRFFESLGVIEFLETASKPDLEAANQRRSQVAEGLILIRAFLPEDVKITLDEGAKYPRDLKMECGIFNATVSNRHAFQSFVEAMIRSGYAE